jgi:hypothetical protein
LTIEFERLNQFEMLDISPADGEDGSTQGSVFVFESRRPRSFPGWSTVCCVFPLDLRKIDNRSRKGMKEAPVENEGRHPQPGVGLSGSSVGFASWFSTSSGMVNRANDDCRLVGKRFVDIRSAMRGFRVGTALTGGGSCTLFFRSGIMAIASSACAKLGYDLRLAVMAS